jgi:hypothetical protein
MRWVEHVACMGENRKVYEVLMRIPKGKRPLRGPRRTWEDRIRIDLGETGWRSVEWIHLAQDKDQWQALVNMVMNLRVLVTQLVSAINCAHYSTFCMSQVFLNY